jgi:2-succinyl-5-enolpyruvyl-6-hydroxy-3-cyclohexene-1-carboxylate synthase|tara:strand:+ start:505 stop:765 length:261 start_codon:yes stop_codon:yes gene_type:complete
MIKSKAVNNFLKDAKKESEKKVDNIQRLFSVVKDKKAFIQLLHDDLKCKTKPQSMRTNWFAGFWNMPDKYKERTIQLLQNTIINQQ